MSDLNIKENNDLYSLEPYLDIITFKLDTDNILELNSNTKEINSKENEIKIKNKSDNYLAFKIKTTKKDNYPIKPGSFILSPKEEIIINIKFRRKEGDNKIKLKSHKILIEGFSIDNEEKNQDINEIFDKYKKNKIQVIGKIITLQTQFLDNNGNNSLKIKETKSKEIENSLYITGGPENDKESEEKINNKEKNLDEKIDFTKISSEHILLALILSLILGLCLFN